MKYKFKEIEINILIGTDRVDAKREAIKVAVENKCNVSFHFNGDDHLVIYDDLISQVK